MLQASQSSLTKSRCKRPQTSSTRSTPGTSLSACTSRDVTLKPPGSSIFTSCVSPRRQHAHAEPLRFLAQGGQLVGVADGQRHGGSQELDRVVLLYPGHLVGNYGVTRRVALVEAVVGELGHRLEDFDRLVFWNATASRAIEENLALGIYLGADLLAQRPAQQVRAAFFAAKLALSGAARLQSNSQDPASAKRFGARGHPPCSP